MDWNVLHAATERTRWINASLLGALTLFGCLWSFIVSNISGGGI